MMIFGQVIIKKMNLMQNCDIATIDHQLGAQLQHHSCKTVSAIFCLTFFLKEIFNINNLRLSATPEPA